MSLRGMGNWEMSKTGLLQGQALCESLAQGVEGQKVWQHPLIVSDLLATILDITGIQIAMPA